MNEPTPGEIRQFFAEQWDNEEKKWMLIQYSIEELKRMFSP